MKTACCLWRPLVPRRLPRPLPPLLAPRPRFYSVISLGREVCGFPRIVHGGLTAAIIDESFGGLLFALKQSRALKFWGPAYTVGGRLGRKGG